MAHQVSMEVSTGIRTVQRRYRTPWFQISCSATAGGQSWNATQYACDRGIENDEHTINKSQQESTRVNKLIDLQILVAVLMLLIPLSGSGSKAGTHLAFFG